MSTCQSQFPTLIPVHWGVVSDTNFRRPPWKQSAQRRKPLFFRGFGNANSNITASSSLSDTTQCGMASAECGTEIPKLVQGFFFTPHSAFRIPHCRDSGFLELPKRETRSAERGALNLWRRLCGSPLMRFETTSLLRCLPGPRQDLNWNPFRSLSTLIQSNQQLLS
jgi:hypothetical protein